VIPGEVIRATPEEKEQQIRTIRELHQTWEKEAEMHLDELKNKAIRNENVFEGIMQAARYCSIGQITQALFEVGGQYRRNM
jgi:methylmalonyl-CoA mutase